MPWTAPSTPSRPWPSRTPSSGSSTPPDLRVEFAQPNAAYPTVVRFSNASGSGQPDFKPDLRGVALRVQVPPDRQHDLLMTNYPVSHARDAYQFVKFATATAGGRLSRALGVVRLISSSVPPRPSACCGTS